MIPTPRICPKHIAATKVGMLMGRMGNLGPTRGLLITDENIKVMMQQIEIAIATLLFHSGVMGTDTAINRFSIKVFLLLLFIGT